MQMTEEQTASLRHRARVENDRTKLSKYGASREPPKDDAVFYPEDDTHSFFARGRDFESAIVNHKYTIQERETLATFESLDYLPSHSSVYKHWLKRQPARLDWDRWVMMGFIGVSVGLIGFLLHQLIDVIADFKWDQANDYIDESGISVAYAWVLGYSVLFVIVSAGLVVFLRPSAGGSGIPELIGFLNGTVVRHIFNVKTMVVKFLSCCAAVGSGMPVGPEGPMIHLGSLVGAGLSQFKSDTMKVKLPFFERFRNSEDRRNFISAGAAAGVASAFGAPVGGLLFSMEEVSSFWNQKLSWQIFFCAMVSTFTTDLFNSAFTGFQYQGQFGLFQADKYILFQVSKGISVNIIAFIPAALLGVIGGILGAIFTFINLKIARARKRLLAKVSKQRHQQVIRMLEPITIMIIVATVSVFLPSGFPCTKYTCIKGAADSSDISEDCLAGTDNPLHVEDTVERYTCPSGTIVQETNFTFTNNTYNQMATLLFGTGENAIKHLFSRNTHLELGYGCLLTVLPVYFILACWAAGTSISSGLVVPMLFIGGLYGRVVGLAMVSMFGVHTEEGSYWAWMDPGAFALVGAASFFGGVSRLTMSLTVIMIEITNDVQFLLPIMAAIMVAKWVGDYVTHPLYHALLELKCIPFLDAEPVITYDGKTMVNLELFQAKHIMAPYPITVTITESVQRLAALLLDTTHGGFPVIKQNNELVFYGFINRLELTVLLMNEDLFVTTHDLDNINPDISHVDYLQLTLDKLHNPQAVQDVLQSYCDDSKYSDLYINLEPYANQSAVSIQSKFSLHRTYIIFRSLGLRHLTVVDEHNHVVGIITRKDLMGFNMEEKLSNVLNTAMATHANVEMNESVNRAI